MPSFEVQGFASRRSCFGARTHFGVDITPVDHHSPGAEVVNNSIIVSSQRECHIAEVRSKGRSEWKRQSGYYLQSQAENAFYRYKRIIGGRLRAKNDDAQKREAAIGCAILNKMLEMGEALSYAVG